ncbi:hypothetical protein GGI07_001928 [Coemansia sp. Benny D115]|nr:hypothetical protein GGI07_001928 [Coemansia sp. Benny D115]
MEDSNYDEFGNYIGPDLGSSSSDAESDNGSENESDHERGEASQGGQSAYHIADRPDESASESEPDTEKPHGLMAMMRRVDIAPPQRQIVLHEDKTHYPTAEEVYGSDVEALVQEEDTQPLSQPIVEPQVTRSFALDTEDAIPETVYLKQFLADLVCQPRLVRNVAVIGHLHHGKTTLVDLLVAATHSWPEWQDTVPVGTPTVGQATRGGDKAHGYTDTLLLERQRGISLKTAAMSVAAQDSRGKSWGLNIVDTPGHADFFDEVEAGLRLADGAVLAVDAAEGVLSGTRRAIDSALRQGVKLTLVITKVDRLILELRLPPADAYQRLRLTVEEVNSAIAASAYGDGARLSPELGNVCFSSASYGWCFTLDAFAEHYAQQWSGAVDSRQLARRLWGDVFYSQQRKAFVRKGVDPKAPRSFVHFVLEPLYKMHAHIVSEDAPELRPLLASLGVRLRQSDYALDSRRLLRCALTAFFGPPSGLVDMCVHHLPSPAAAARSLMQHLCVDTTSETAQAIDKCDASGPLVIAVAKLIAASDGRSLAALGRVLSGTVEPGQNVRVLGESFNEDSEDCASAAVSELWLSCARYRLPVSAASAGALVLLGGVDLSIAKTATIVSADSRDPSSLRPLRLPTPVVRLALEPAVPSELPQLLQGLRSVCKTYPLAQTRVEESGAHVILGSGELYLDCVLHDLRRVFAAIDIRVADPAVSFRECVAESSALRVFADSPNRKNRITLVSEPLDSAVARDIEQGVVSDKWPARQLGAFFETNHGWDTLAARSIWAFGPGPEGPNVLNDDTLPAETNKQRLRGARDAIRQGFQWAVREGPLCDEPMRDTRFRILDATLAESPVHRGAGQIIPAARRVCYSAFLVAEPRLMEPVNAVEIQCPADCVSAVYTVLARRRGHVTKDTPLAGSPLYIVSALIPTIDSSGFETDLRTYTGGKAFCQQYFDHWQVVPGNPLDKDIVLRPLEPSSGQQLARDFMLKTRRRKGLGDDVSIEKYIDDPELLGIVKSFQ